MSNKIKVLQGDCRKVLKTLPTESVHCVVCSPPYWGLRDYGTTGQLGLEKTPDAYVATMVEVFREVRRVLRKDGTLWLNLGDSYNSSPAGANPGGFQGAQMRKNKAYDKAQSRERIKGTQLPGLKTKDLVGIPWRVAFALQADGWWLRQDIIWFKPNPMPESATDRCTKSHEYVFLLSKSPHYFYDAVEIAEQGEPWHSPGQDATDRASTARPNGGYNAGLRIAGERDATTRNKRSVWEVALEPYAEAHFATFPPHLIQPMILAGSPAECCAKCGAPWLREIKKVKAPRGDAFGRKDIGKYDHGQAGSPYMATVESRTTGWKPSCKCNARTVPGTVLDPFAGSGTTGFVAKKFGRNAVLIELNSEYCTLAKKRVSNNGLWRLRPVEQSDGVIDIGPLFKRGKRT